jgi:uncharacterized protein (TIGR02118 family)
MLFPNALGSTFNENYYFYTHLPIIHRLLDSRGLIRVEIDKGLSGSDPNVPPAFVFAVHLMFNSVEVVHEAFKIVGRELLGDISNFTDSKLQVQISEVVS